MSEDEKLPVKIVTPPPLKENNAGKSQQPLPPSGPPKVAPPTPPPAPPKK